MSGLHQKNIALSSQIAEVYRKDQWEYPLEAIREAISNAIIHRDYAVPGSDIKVAIFDDMLEITSPERYRTPCPLRSWEPDARNQESRSCTNFKDLKLIEAWGTGIQKMQKRLRTDRRSIICRNRPCLPGAIQKKPKPEHIAKKKNGL